MSVRKPIIENQPENRHSSSRSNRRSTSPHPNSRSRTDSLQRAAIQKVRRYRQEARTAYEDTDQPRRKRNKHKTSKYSDKGASSASTITSGYVPYATEHPRKSSHKPKRHRGTRNLVIVVVLVIVALGVFIYLWKNPPIFDVTINGSTYRVNAGTTLQTAVDNGYAYPQAGDLIAVDGSIAVEGGGDTLAATVDGVATNDPQTRLSPNDIIKITDGADVEEAYTELTQTITHGTTEDDGIDDPNSYYVGSIHIYSDGEDGEEIIRTGNVSGKTVTEVTKEPVDAGYHTYTADVGDEKVIALTFDDGPWYSTEDILDILKEYDIHATFFIIGNQVAEYPEAIQREYEEGHQLASHTWDHDEDAYGYNITYLSADEQIEEVTKGFEAIDEAIGTEVSHVLRAPGGSYYGSDTILNLHPYVTAEIGWDVDTEDWSLPGTDFIVEMMESVQPGQIILCHDGGGDRSQTIEALKIALPYLKEQGFEFVTIDELLAYDISSKTSSDADA